MKPVPPKRNRRSAIIQYMHAEKCELLLSIPYKKFGITPIDSGERKRRPSHTPLPSAKRWNGGSPQAQNPIETTALGPYKREMPNSQ